MTLPAETEKRAVVEAMFDRISPRYDRMNRLMTFGIDRSWRSRAITALALRPGSRVLDLACGTGDLIQEIRHAGGEPVGVDISAGMLRHAAQREGPGGLVRADALALPFPESSCDAVVSGFALRNFVGLPAALAECARVLRPGGRFAFLEVDTPPNRLLRLGHRIYFHRIVPWMGRLLADAKAYAYLPASTSYLPADDELLGLLRTSGFDDVRKTRLLGGVAQLLTGERG